MTGIEKVLLNNPDLNVIISIVIGVVIFLAVLRIAKKLIRAVITVIAVLLMFNISWFNVARDVVNSDFIDSYVSPEIQQKAVMLVDEAEKSEFFKDMFPFSKEYKILKTIKNLQTKEN